MTTKEHGGEYPISVKLQIVKMIKIQKLDVKLMPMTVDYLVYTLKDFRSMDVILTVFSHKKKKIEEEKGK